MGHMEEVHKIRGEHWDLPLCTGAMSDLLETHLFPHTSYHAEFGRSCSNCTDVSEGPKKLGVLVPRPLGWSLADLLETPLPHMCYMPNLVALGWRVQA